MQIDTSKINWSYLYTDKNFIRNYKDVDRTWELVKIDKLSIDQIREFRYYIMWPQQFYILQYMWKRWDIADKKFFKEFKREINWCEDRWGEFWLYDTGYEGYDRIRKYDY